MSEKKSCCFTGHRQILREDQPTLQMRLHDVVERLYREGCRDFYAGGALGFDTVAAECVLALREKRKDVRLHLILPCQDQTRGWRPADAARYAEILHMADTVTYTAKTYEAGCMQRRNRALVDAASVCVAYLRRDTGGTAYTVQYAQKKGIPVLPV